MRCTAPFIIGDYDLPHDLHGSLWDNSRPLKNMFFIKHILNVCSCNKTKWGNKCSPLFRQLKDSTPL